MREWRAALYRLRNTRIDGVNAAITTIQNDSKDDDGNVVKALVGNPMSTAKRWLVQLAAVDVCHDATCCPETKLLKDDFKTHPIEAALSERVARPNVNAPSDCALTTSSLVPPVYSCISAETLSGAWAG
ncbi:unnamed protein product [Ectocarpus sp. 12 AP-2014]